MFTQFVLVSCSDDDDGYSDVDGLPPTIELTTSSIQAEAGREFVIKGKITDKDGLASIQLVNTDLYLDKTINLKKDTIITDFELDYKFLPEADFKETDKFELKVIVTDLGGRVTEKIITITMDGDFTAPKITTHPEAEITLLLTDNVEFELKVAMEDDKELSKVSLSIPGLNYNKEFTTFAGDKKSLEYNEVLQFPSDEAIYYLTTTVIDTAGFVTTSASQITVTRVADFARMYLVDVETVAELTNSVMGVPMLVDRTAPYTYRARYYNEKTGTKVRFMPQKKDFKPVCFGIDPANQDSLIYDPDTSLPIVLNNKGYYEINFNVKDGSYKVEQYTPTDEYVPIGSDYDLDGSGQYIIPIEIGLVGKGFPNGEGTLPSKLIPLNQHTDNKYIFSVELNFTAPSEVRDFIISARHSWDNWWPELFWRWDKTEDPEANVSKGGDNGTVQVKKAGKYIVKFDSHLLRTQFYPIN